MLATNFEVNKLPFLYEPRYVDHLTSQGALSGAQWMYATLKQWLNSNRAQIPSYRILTVELNMTKLQRSNYDRQHYRLANMLPAGYAENIGEGLESGRMYQAACRNLCQFTVNQELIQLNRKVESGVEFMSDVYESFHDIGVTRHFERIRSTSYLPRHRDKPGLALYISTLSPKYQFLSALVYEVCLQQETRLTIYTHWPRTLWLADMYLTLRNLK